MTDDRWQEYLDATGERGARPLLLQALEHAPPAGRALDLGCGAGGDTLCLLERGFHVLAVDALEAAVNHTKERAQAAGLSDRLDARAKGFEALGLDREGYGA